MAFNVVKNVHNEWICVWYSNTFMLHRVHCIPLSPLFSILLIVRKQSSLILGKESSDENVDIVLQTKRKAWMNCQWRTARSCLCGMASRCVLYRSTLSLFAFFSHWAHKLNGVLLSCSMLYHHTFFFLWKFYPYNQNTGIYHCSRQLFTQDYGVRKVVSHAASLYLAIWEGRGGGGGYIGITVFVCPSFIYWSVHLSVCLVSP